MNDERHTMTHDPTIDERAPPFIVHRPSLIASSAPWLTLGGSATLLVGLAWDAVLHRLDPALASREGILTLANPGHALFAAGLGLSVIGSLLLLADRIAAWHARPRAQQTVLRASLLGFVALATVSGGLSVWSSLGAPHSHAASTNTPCTQLENAAHDHSHPLGSLAAHSHAIDLAAVCP